MVEEISNASDETVHNPAKKTVKRRRASAPSSHKIDKSLSAIYEGGGGVANVGKIKIQKSNPFWGFLIIVLISLGILSAAAWMGFFALPGSTKFSEDQVELKITGSEQLTLGETSTYTISFKNFSPKINLRNVILNISYPNGFVFEDSSTKAKNSGNTEWDIGTLVAMRDGSVTITGKSYGGFEQGGSWRVFLKYRPDNFNSELQKAATLNTKIVTSPITITASGPDKATVGGEAEFTFTVKNIGEWWPEKLEVTPSFPANFYLTSSSPLLLKNKWGIYPPANLGTSTTVQSSFVFSARGKFSPSEEEISTTGAELNMLTGKDSYKIAEASLRTVISKNSLDLGLAINGSTKNISSHPGDTLNISLNLKNSSKFTMKGTALKLILEAPAIKKQGLLDWAKIVDQLDGDITGEQLGPDVRRGTVIWRSKHLPSITKIKPDNTIIVEVQLPIKDAAAFDLSAIKEPVIQAVAELEFLNQSGVKNVVSSNPITITLNTNLEFEARDAVTPLDDGKEKHAISWVLKNSFHTLKNLRLTADIYGDVTMEEIKKENIPAGEVVSSTTIKNIIWTIPEMPESVDVLALPFTIILNKKNPTQELLVSKVHVQGEDAVTGEPIDFMGDEVPLIIYKYPLQ